MAKMLRFLTHKYLESVFDFQIKFDVNAECVANQGQQSIHILRLESKLFYVCTMWNVQSFVESVLTFSFTCWFDGLSVKDKNSLYSIVKVCSKQTKRPGVQERDLCSLWESQVVQKAKGIIS